MKKRHRHFRLALFSVVALGSPARAATGFVDVPVTGLVCSFCAQGLLRRAETNPKIEKSEISLAKHRLRLWLKPGAEISPVEVKALVEDAGFRVGTAEARPEKGEAKERSESATPKNAPP